MYNVINKQRVMLSILSVLGLVMLFTQQATAGESYLALEEHIEMFGSLAIALIITIFVVSIAFTAVFASAVAIAIRYRKAKRYNKYKAANYNLL